MSVSYGAGGRVYVTVEERVTTKLFSFADAVRDRLLDVMSSKGMDIAQATRAAYSGHSKTGALASSVRSQTRVYGVGTSIWTSIMAGGTARVRYAHLFEKGFSGEQQVSGYKRITGHRTVLADIDPEHHRFTTRRISSGFDVRAYRRTVTYRPHGYMEAALDSRRAAIRDAIFAAIDRAADEKGLAA